MRQPTYKKYLLAVLLLLSLVSTAQEEDDESKFKKVYFTAESGASTFLSRPFVSLLMFDVECTDDKVPLVINFKNGFLLTPKEDVFLWAMSVGRRIGKTTEDDYTFVDVGIMYGFMGNVPMNNSYKTAGIYYTLNTIKNFSLRTEILCNFARYSDAYERNNMLGVNIAINYKIALLEGL